VIVDKTTSVVSLVLLLFIGLVVGGILLPIPRPLTLAVIGALALETLCVAGFIAVQLRGAMGGGGRLLARVRLSPGPDRQAALDAVDRALRATYTTDARRVLASVACHLLGFALGTLEIYLVVSFLGLPISPVTAFTLGAFGTAVKFFTFMIPGSLGALEGGNVALFAALGLPGAAGLAYSLVRRLREIAWVLAGFAALSLLSARLAPAGEPGAGSPASSGAARRETTAARAAGDDPRLGPDHVSAC
jgi:hypothetical protein